jgi:hypothetical protein
MTLEGRPRFAYLPAKRPPMDVCIDDTPQLKALCWNRPGTGVVDRAEALALYERNWRFVDRAAMTEDEQRLLAALVARYGNGVLHVSA